MDRSPVPGPAVEREGRGNNDGSTLTFPKASNSALISASIWVISFVLRCILLFWYLSLYSSSLYCPVLVAYHTLRLCDNPGPWYYISVSYTHLRAHETASYLVCRPLLDNK